MADGVEQRTLLPEEVLSLEIERTDEPLVARGGLVLPHQMAEALGVAKKVDQELPLPGSGRGLPPSAYVMPMLLMLHGGGRALEDLQELRAEVSLRHLLKMKRLPASCTVGDWLRRMGKDGRGLAGLDRVNGHLAEQVLTRRGEREYILDLDATIIPSEKAEAHWTYKKVKGYQPVIGFVQNSAGKGGRR